MRGADKWFSTLIISYKRAKGNDFIRTTSSNSSEFIQNSITSGFGVGYKWSTYKGLVLELSAGYERSLFVQRKRTQSDEITKNHTTQQFFINVNLGYRFKRNI